MKYSNNIMRNKYIIIYRFLASVIMYMKLGSTRSSDFFQSLIIITL